MDGTGKQKIINTALCFCAGVVVGVLATLFCLRGADAGGDGTSTAQQISRAERLNELAERENRAAGAAVAKASGDAERAAELNQRAQAELATSAELLEQVRADNQRAKRILAELIGGTKAGAETDTKN